MIALVDCNNFYASCERVFQPHLVGEPIVILSNNDGCVIARSDEAKAINVPMGVPAYQIEDRVQCGEIHAFSSNYALYGDMSARVMNTLATYTPEIDVYSIDEAFLDFGGMDHLDLEQLGKEMRAYVTQSTGIPISVGLGPTKVVAKLANRITKKFKAKTNGVYTIDTEAKRIKALKWLAVGDVWGIGKGLAQRLERMGVKTAYEFTQLSDEWVQKNMTVVGLRLKHELTGLARLHTPADRLRKNIATTRSFATDLTDYDAVRERIATYASMVARKLRAEKVCCNTITVFIKTNKNKEDAPQYSRRISVDLPYSTQSTIEVVQAATIALQQIWREGCGIKKGGVIAQRFVPEDQRTMNLFAQANSKHDQLMQTLDTINQKHGQDMVRIGAQDTGKTWKMRRERLSPRYTTQLSDIITVKA